MSNNNQREHQIDVYSLVTNRIIELMEAGSVPWRKSWTSAGIPRNAISKRAYHGINIMLLNAYGFSRNLFLTWQQIKELNGSVIKGEKGIMIIFTKTLERDVEKGGTHKTEKKSMLRYYTVFNIAQCKDLPAELTSTEAEDLPPIPSCVSIVEGMKNAPAIVHKKPDGFYYPPEDYINMPKMKSFKTNEDYYGILFHELIHSTGHQSRLKRPEVFENPKFRTQPYSLEELTAEIGACYLRSHAGLSMNNMPQSADYIKNWLSVFKGDNKILIQAASRAQKAVEYILDPNPGEVCASKEVIAEAA